MIQFVGLFDPPHPLSRPIAARSLSFVCLPPLPLAHAAPLAPVAPVESVRSLHITSNTTATAAVESQNISVTESLPVPQRQRPR